MKRRIGFWGLAGFVVAYCWVMAGMIGGPGHNLERWTIVAITAPASLLGRNMPLGYYWFVLLNAGIYALVGLTIELTRRHRPGHP